MNERWLSAQGAQARGQDMTPRECVVAYCAARVLVEELGLERLAALVCKDCARESTLCRQQAYWRSLAGHWRQLAVTGEQWTG